MAFLELCLSKIFVNYLTQEGISTPELSMVCKLADCFEISVDKLLGRTNCLLPEEKFSLEKIESAQKAVLQIYAMIKE